MKGSASRFLVLAALLVFAGALTATGLYAEPKRKCPSCPDQQLRVLDPLPVVGPQSLMLYTRRGERLEARQIDGGYQAFVFTKAGKRVAADGPYKLQGGGEIAVKKGRIVWADDIARRRSSVAGVQMPLP